ncbi:MAG TPA: serine/threonine-protein kinase, partial [Polyangiaceae bacterium]
MTQGNGTKDAVEAETLAADPVAPAMAARSLSPAVAATLRTTVLPRRQRAEASVPAEISVQARFERLKKLGEGGIGEVDLAVDHDISRRVAMKRLRGERQDAASLVRFAEEVRIVGQLEHPGIVPVHDVGVDEAGHYLVMKYVEGDTLETVIDKLRNGDPETVARFSLSYRVQVFASILEAISYAHDKGIIHRDIKPANIMIGPHGEVTVMDWGIAKYVNSHEHESVEASSVASTVQERLIHTQHGALVGTPLYMSPEQAAGKNTELDVRSDIFSLGVVFAEFLSLRHPLAHKQTMSEILAELIAKGIDFGALVNHGRQNGMPMELAYVLRESLEHDPKKRYPNVKAMLAHVRRIQDGEVAVQCHVTAFKRLAYEAIH